MPKENDPNNRRKTYSKGFQGHPSSSQLNLEDFIKNLPPRFEVPEGRTLPDGAADALKHQLSAFLTPQELESLSLTGPEFSRLTAFERSQNKLKGAPLFKELSDAVVKANQDRAEAIIKDNPHFLYKVISEENKVHDFLNKEVFGVTPFQIALRAGDVEMAEMMKPYFEALTVFDGTEELQSQFNKIYPNGVEAHAEVQENKAFDFNEILTAIRTARDEEVQQALNKNFSADTPLNTALTNFRLAFDKKSAEEKIFNPQHLLKAFECYNKNFDALATWHKQDLFWRQVIGYVQRHLPACYLQAFAQGIYFLVEEGEKLARYFEFRWEEDRRMRPDNVDAGLGFDWAVWFDPCSFAECFLAAGSPPGVALRRSVGGPFAKIMSGKKIKLAKIMSGKKIKLGEITATPISLPFARCVIS